MSSIFWMVLRTTLEPREYDESAIVSLQGFQKELGAAQTLFSDHQVVSYSAFFRDRAGMNDPGHWWVRQAHDIRDTFTRSMKNVTLYPHINRKKNVSDETSAQYRIYDDLRYVRTLDLELLRMRIGVEVEGNAELRTAWKFNDLKPRLYYCNGGQQYWSSTYIKVVAVKIMEAIPSTSVKIRISPDKYLSSVPDIDTVIAWDFSSFTSTLSELKYFIWFVARLAERSNIHVRLFDYQQGFVDASLSELIDTYNEVANLHAPYEIHRMVGKYLTDNNLTMNMVNNGMLGVAGNIGFSTALHGFVVCRECGSGRCVCVGDDALGILADDPNKSLIPALSSIGVIHPEKSGVIAPSAPEGDYIKFLKRKFERVGDRFRMSYLFNVPISPYIDGEAGERTTPIDFSLEARTFKVVSQIQTVLWEVLAHPDLSDDDWDIMVDFLGRIYRIMYLPLDGLLPGSHLRVPDTHDLYKVPLAYTIPRLKGLDARREDWMDYLINNTPCMFFKGPVYMLRSTNITSLREGECLMMNESPWISAMEDMGFLEKTVLQEWLYVAEVSSQRILRKMSRRLEDGMVRAVGVKCLRSIPECYVDAAVEEKVDAVEPMEWERY